MRSDIHIPLLTSCNIVYFLILFVKYILLVNNLHLCMICYLVVKLIMLVYAFFFFEQECIPFV